MPIPAAAPRLRSGGRHRPPTTNGRRLFAALCVLAANAGCGGKVVVDDVTTGTGGAGATGGAGTGGEVSALLGIWAGSTGGPTRLAETIKLTSGGKATAVDKFEVIGDGATPCSGELDITDDWIATATTFSVSGGTCMGQVSCPNGETIPCGTAETEAQSCTYSLSNGGDTLELDCPAGNGPIFYTRVIP